VQAKYKGRQVGSMSDIVFAFVSQDGWSEAGLRVFLNKRRAPALVSLYLDPVERKDIQRAVQASVENGDANTPVRAFVCIWTDMAVNFLLKFFQPKVRRARHGDVEAQECRKW
jgi:hypothetical protein